MQYLFYKAYKFAQEAGEGQTVHIWEQLHMNVDGSGGGGDSGKPLRLEDKEKPRPRLRLVGGVRRVEARPVGFQLF